LYARKLSIYGFRCFGKTVIDLQYPGRTEGTVSELDNVNLILGDNGGGKSSVLRALAIAALAPALVYQGFVAHRLVRRTKADETPGTDGRTQQALLKVNAVVDSEEQAYSEISENALELLARIDRAPQGDNDRLHTNSTPNSPIEALLSDDRSPSFFIVGYGATRRVETGDFSEGSARKSRGMRYQRVASLFEDQVTLRPMHAWARKLDPGRLAEVTEIFNATLPPMARFSGLLDAETEQFVFEFDGLPTPMSSLSDGYKAFIGWIGDLIGHLVDVTPSSQRLLDVRGIVLVDEIDLHLHPEWQRSVVPNLARTFRNLQFVMTSHSPIVASTVKRQNVFVTDVDTNGGAIIRQLEERVFGRSAEQLLLSSYFGLSTTRPAEFQETSETLFKRAAAGDSDAALEYLDQLRSPDEAADVPNLPGAAQP
jgi:hypothetical protein